MLSKQEVNDVVKENENKPSTLSRALSEQFSELASIIANPNLCLFRHHQLSEVSSLRRSRRDAISRSR